MPLDVFFWIHPHERGWVLDVADRVLPRAKPALAGVGIDIPCCTMQVPLHSKTEATDGDRVRQCEGWPARGGGQDRPSRPIGAAGRAQ